MFKGLINDAKSAVGSVAAKYAARATVAVPFLIAVGFGIAALTVLLVDRFGALTAYAAMAGGFLALGLVAAAVVTGKEQEAEVAEAEAEVKDTAGVASDAATQAAVQLPLVLIGSLLTTPGGPQIAAGGVRFLGRNFSLVLFLALLGLLFWPSKQQDAVQAAQASDAPPEQSEFPEDDVVEVRRNGRHWSGNGRAHPAA